MPHHRPSRRPTSRLTPRLAAGVAALGLLATAGAASAGTGDAATARASVPLPAAAADRASDPVRVLVFSKAFGFSHTDSIVKGAAYLDGLDGPEFVVDGTTDPTALHKENLARYDVLVWNNSTGEVPLDAQRRQDLLDWVRAGNGWVGVHSAGDSNYTWPEFAELAGGFYDGHWYRFGGITPEPYRLKMVREDADNPLLAGVPESYDSYDETYKWQLDVRPDVHVLMSLDNTSIGAQGALYSWRQPLTWCRPLGEGRTFYTNLGHDGALWSDPVFTRLVRNALSYAGGRLGADCSVPADPANGVKGEDRLGAAWSSYTGARPAVSTYSGGAAVLTGITAGKTTITYPDLDLDGVTGIDVFAAAQEIAQPSTFAIAGGPQAARWTQVAGGTVQVRLGSATGPVLGTTNVLPASPPVPVVNAPDEAEQAEAVANGAASWRTTRVAIAPQKGEHDLVLTFAPSPASPAVGAVASGRDQVGSLGWIALRR